ncbi:MAG TPA: hypothetical protein VEB18_04160 [Candidatus Paceibacterota bacterium]|nr:hypothetical protein [Candidatus Paceibacterota bacterium]
MIRWIVVVLALVSPLLFPYPVTLALSFAGALFVPIIGLLAGVFTDVLYYAPHPGIYPLATIAGAGISLIAFFVRRFIKARIIGG